MALGIGHKESEEVGRGGGGGGGYGGEQKKRREREREMGGRIFARVIVFNCRLYSSAPGCLQTKRGATRSPEKWISAKLEEGKKNYRAVKRFQENNPHARSGRV